MKAFISWLFFLVVGVACIPVWLLGFFYYAASFQFKNGCVRFEKIRRNFTGGEL